MPSPHLSEAHSSAQVIQENTHIHNFFSFKWQWLLKDFAFVILGCGGRDQGQKFALTLSLSSWKLPEAMVFWGPCKGIPCVKLRLPCFREACFQPCKLTLSLISTAEDRHFWAIQLLFAALHFHSHLPSTKCPRASQLLSSVAPEPCRGRGQFPCFSFFSSVAGATTAHAGLLCGPFVPFSFV